MDDYNHIIFYDLVKQLFYASQEHKIICAVVKHKSFLKNK